MVKSKNQSIYTKLSSFSQPTIQSLPITNPILDPGKKMKNFYKSILHLALNFNLGKFLDQQDKIFSFARIIYFISYIHIHIFYIPTSMKKK